MKALGVVVRKLEAAGVVYQITGGVAGNFYGSLWPVHDIDVDVRGDLGEVAKLFAGASMEGPLLYEDAEFLVPLLRVVVEGVEVEFTDGDALQVWSEGAWVEIGTDWERRERRTLAGVEAWVQPLDALIAYKRLLGRDRDLAELERLVRR